MKYLDHASQPSPIPGVNRRRVLTAGGITLVAAFTGCRSSTAVSVPSAGVAASPRAATAAAQVAEAALVQAVETLRKPVFVPDSGAKDPVSFSLADTLFWTDILMEHGQFFVTLMPGDELAQHRAEAQRFQQTFAQQFDRARAARIDSSNYATLNRSTVELVKPFIDWKRRLGDAQAKGKIRSLVWPDFFEHTALEAERFTRRLDQLARGNPELDRSEVIEFWAKIMEDHAEFIAHLLDPQEKTLIAASRKSADLFGKLQNTPDAKVKALAEGQAMVAFKTAATKGIEEGKIKSIIHPTLADHVRREAVKFVDELKRA
jgi:Domain of unknown function (DUF2935)